MKNLLEFILIHLCDNPDAIRIDQSEEADGLQVYTIHVDPADMGKIIGRQGNVIHAIRTLARVRAVKENTRINVRIAEDETAPEVTAPVAA